jgi:ankyrin repeat protein
MSRNSNADLQYVFRIWGRPVLFGTIAGLLCLNLYSCYYAEMIANRTWDAIRAGDSATVTAILAKGIQPDTISIDGNTPLMIAAQKGDASLVKLLIDRGSDPVLPLILSNDETCSRLLLNAFPKSHKSQTERQRVIDVSFHRAASNSNPDLCRVLLAAGAQINSPGDFGQTPLMEWATISADSAENKEMQRETFALLMAAGANPDATDASHSTALDLARQYDNNAAVHLLASIRGTDQASRSPFSASNASPHPASSSDSGGTGGSR